MPLKIESKKSEISQTNQNTQLAEQPSMKEFPKSIKRILTNNLLMMNIFSGVFYVLSASAFMNFIAKYLEVQFQTSPGGGTVITGKFTFIYEI